MIEQKLKDVRSLLDKRKGEAHIIRNDISAKVKENKQLKVDLEKHEQALTIIKEVGRKTQEKLQYHMSDIATLAFDAILTNPYKLIVEFVERRDKIECDLLFERNGKFSKPLDSTGGGAVDIASFALRVASWSMQKPRSRKTMVLDEPFKNLDKSKQEKASTILKQISSTLGIQFIIITHEDKLTEAADRVFEVSIKNEISKVEQIR
jgi:DNA repair exonuclease SbcCD ATPase subunit